jgi:cytoskeleton protein RodZ
MDTRDTAEHERVAFGQFLRQARERRRLTLEQIAGETKIAPRLLTSLERGDVQPMPKGMYRRAMLRAYAESVGLDTQAALSEFERTFEEPPPREAPLPILPPPAPQQQARRSPSGGRRAWLPVTLTLAFAAVIALAFWALTGDPARVVPISSSQITTGRGSPARPVPPAPLPRTSANRTEPTATSGTHDRAGTDDTAATAIATTLATPQVAAPPLATEGQLVVVSDPPGARVTVNGVGWGSTPITINYLPLGQKRVRLTMPGYISEERTVRVDGRRPSATVRATLSARR